MQSTAWEHWMCGTSWASYCTDTGAVSPAIATLSDAPDGAAGDGVVPWLVDPHPQSHATDMQAAATNNERMKFPRLTKAKLPVSHAHGSRADARTLTLYQRNAALCWPTSEEPQESCS